MKAFEHNRKYVSAVIVRGGIIHSRKYIKP